MGQNRLSHMTVALLMKALLEDSRTSLQLAEITGLHITTMRNMIIHLRRHKVIHIEAWEKDRGNHYSLAVYALGSRPDAKKPPPTPKHIRALTWKSRNKSRRLNRIDQAVVKGKRSEAETVAAPDCSTHQDADQL